MRILLWLLIPLLATDVCISEAYAQAGKKKKMRVFSEPVLIRLSRGDTLLVDCDSAFVFNREAELIRREQIRIDDSLTTQFRARVALGDSIKALKDSVITGFQSINDIQNKSYWILRTKFVQADSLVRVSTANTDAALSYIKKVKVTSFLASGLAGGVVGGFGIKQSGQEGFNWWPGFVTGAAIGIGINWALTSLL